MSLKNQIQLIISEETDSNPKIQKLLRLIGFVGIMGASKLMGGYDVLRKVMKGHNFLTRENMIKTIQDFIEYNGTFTLNEIGLEEIPLYEDDDTLRQLYYLDKKGFEVSVYQLDDNGDWDEDEQTTEYYGYNRIDKDGKYILDTIHLYEIVDSIMEYYETYLKVNSSINESNLLKEENGKLDKINSLIDKVGIYQAIKFVGGYDKFERLLPDYFSDREHKIDLINSIVDNNEPDGYIYMYDINGMDIKIWEEAGENGHTLEDYMTHVGDGTVGVSVYEYDEEGEMYDEQVDGYYIKLGKLQDKWLNKVFELLVSYYM